LPSTFEPFERKRQFGAAEWNLAAFPTRHGIARDTQSFTQLGLAEAEQTAPLT
jgi:hypothetical protein